MNSETYNMLALGGLLLGKVILLTLLVCYCCKTRRTNDRDSFESSERSDESGAHIEIENKLRKEVEELDKPPKYNNVVLRNEPPGYLESVINAQINPVFNANWAEDLEKGEVDKEIEQIISRTRDTSVINQLMHSRLGFDAEFDDSEAPMAAQRQNNMEEISQEPQRVRTASLTQPVASIWIGN